MLISRRTFGRVAVAAGLLLAAPAFAAEPEQVEIRYLASQGGLAAHELAAALGYFKDTGITLKNVGYAQGGPASLFALASGDVEIGGAATAAVLNSIAVCGSACANDANAGRPCSHARMMLFKRPGSDI